MLVLTLRRGREVRLIIPGETEADDQEVRIQVLDWTNREMRIGITAPDEIEIERVKREETRTDDRA